MGDYRKLVLFLGDIVSFGAGFLLFILALFPPQSFVSGLKVYLLPFFILVILWLGVLFIFNFYDTRASKPNLVFLRNFGIAAVVMLAIGFIFFYIDPTTKVTPKTHLVIFEAISLALVLGWRRLFYLTTSQIIHTNLAIVCADERHQTLVDEISNNPQLGFVCVGTFQSIGEFLEKSPAIDLLVIHKTALQETELLEKILASQVDVIDLADAYESILYKIPVNFINDHWVIHSIKKQGGALYQVFSRVASIGFAVVVGIVTFPISVAIVLGIKLEDGGPIFIKQERVGKNGTIFKLYKFRSMIVLGKDGQAETSGAVWSTGGDDKRVTKVGKITRKLHIDEIPQMINLLLGDLTLVGPRPERPEFVEKLEKQIPYYFMRHAIQPGFTGWAQIKFRYARTILDSQEKFEYDLFYIKNRNIFLDMGIILKTAQIIFTHLE